MLSEQCPQFSLVTTRQQCLFFVFVFDKLFFHLYNLNIMSCDGEILVSLVEMKPSINDFHAMERSN